MDSMTEGARVSSAMAELNDRPLPQDWPPNSRLGRRMKPYIARVRLRARDIDALDLDSPRKLTQILSQQNISADQAPWVVTQTLDLAADHRLANLRRKQSLHTLEHATQKLNLLKTLIDALVQIISKFPSRSTAKLNKILAEQDWQRFDTEVLADVVHAMIRVFPELPPACVAQEAALAINETPLPASDHNAIKDVIRTAPPAILDLWEAIPAETRVRVEANIRRRSWKSVILFLRHMSTMLAASRPNAKRGRPVSITPSFARPVAAVWRRLGLHVGSAYFGGNREREPAHCDSSFQRFCREALRAVGDDSHVSNRQVGRLKLANRPQ
jgi:hypothetical protein